MKITGLRIDGFGVWSGLELSDLPGEVTVLYGENEAGKTTLMQFVRSVLYGFSAQRGSRYLPPVRPGRPGGVVFASAGDRQYTIRRHADEAGEMGAHAIVTTGADDAADVSDVERLLGDVDEATFNNVFAFGLREIQELGTLSDTQAADELYSLALGLDRVSLLDVMRELETSRTRLLAPDERPSLVTQLLSQRDRLRAEIDELRQGTSRYLTLSAERDKLAAEITRLEAEMVRFEQQGRELALARALAEPWQRRAAIDEQLSGLGGFDGLPDDALEHFERLESRLAARKRRFDKLAELRGDLRRQIAELNINEALCRAGLRLEALGEQQHWIASLEEQVAGLRDEVARLEARRDESAEQFGVSPDAIPEGGGGLSKRVRSELRATARTIQSTRQEIVALQDKVDVARATAAAHDRQLAASIDEDNPNGLTHSLAEAGELVSQLRRRVQIDQRLDQMSRREAELEAQSQEHYEKQVLPTWVIVGVGGLFVLGCALVLLYLAALVLPISFSQVLGWPVGLVGVLAAASAALVKVSMEHSASRKLDSCQSQIQLLGQQMEQVKSERDDLDAQLPRGGGPLVARLKTAEEALARLEGLLPMEAQRESAEREATTVDSQLQAKQAELRELKKRWRRQLSDAGLPQDLRPRQVRQYAARRDELSELVERIAATRQELAARQSEYNTAAGRVEQLVAEVGLAPDASRPVERLRAALSELAQQQSRIKDREQLSQQIAVATRRQKKINRQARMLRQRRRMLLEAAGTSDVVVFRRLARAQAESNRLRSERDALAADIAATIAGQVDEELLAQWMASPHELEEKETHVADARRIAADHVSQALVRRGEMNQQLKSMLDDRRLADKRVELGIVEKRLNDALERWRVVATCGVMLESVRAYYEREHQPPALQEASTYLKELTRGRYTRVWTPLGEHRLVVDDEGGNPLNVELLSRGTREQLFLALRLALVNAYARRGVELPLVLDDVLVNFDAGRAKAAAGVLRDFARAGHQLLVFTCHEHVARMFRQLKVEVRQLPDNGQSHVAAPRPKRPRRRKPAAKVAAPPKQQPAEPAVAEVEPEMVPRPAPVPVQRPATPPPKRRIRRVEWSAEEFEGELADRVSRTVAAKRESPGGTTGADADDDEEAEAA